MTKKKTSATEEQLTTDNGEQTTPETDDTAAPKSDAEELAELRDHYLRAVAENENQRRRAEEKIANTRKFALSTFSTDICGVCDCLESALTTENDTNKLREGVTLTLRKLTAVMEAHNIRPIRPDEGAPFDPNLHQSVGITTNDNLPPQTVATVVQTGYTLNGRVIRAASILLNKLPKNNGSDNS